MNRTFSQRYSVRCVSEQRLYVVWDREKGEPVTSTLPIDDCNEIAKLLNQQDQELDERET